MYFLPIEAKIDVLKFLDFNQLFSVRLINWHFNALIEQYELDFARKKQSHFYISNLDEQEYELYRCKEEFLEEDVKEEKISFLKRIWNCCLKKSDKKIVKKREKCTCDRRFLNNEELEPFNFPISSQLFNKWQTVIDQQIPIYLDIRDHPVDEDIAIILIPDYQIFKRLAIKLPVFPKNIEEMKIIRCWFYRLFLCYFGTIEYCEFIFNPELVKLLFDDDDDNYLKLSSLLARCFCYCDKPKINAVKFIANYHIISNEGHLLLHFDPLPEDFKQYSKYLFKILTTGGFKMVQVIDRSLKDDALFYWIINHIETSTDLTKMVANMVLHFDGWSDLNLSERAENIVIDEGHIYYRLSNIHNSEMKYNVSISKRSFNGKVETVVIKKMWGDNVDYNIMY
ncbi:hypothetical protein ACQ4LE_005678 [Meloidogyne hapla]|uniref:F-box domain-containing protein n=1 Tax=Meloidogyne hapla TaxID=6305 RepID=A0A1I8BL15_MELHA